MTLEGRGGRLKWKINYEKVKKMGDRSWIRLFIQPRLQARFLILILLAGLLGAIVFGAYINLQSRVIFELAGEIEESQRVQELQSWLQAYAIISIIVFFLGITLLFFVGLLYTHRLIGPMKRLKRELENMERDEEIRLCRVRTSDYLYPFFKRLNRVLINATWEELDKEEKD